MTPDQEVGDHGKAIDVLIVYGSPPEMRLRDATGRNIRKEFALTRSNQGSFEGALRHALANFLGGHVDTARARMVFVSNAESFFKAIKDYPARHVIYYGHALDGSNVLLPTIGNSITAWQLYNALKSSGTSDFDILGCASSGIAAELSTMLPKKRIGYLRLARYDNVEVEVSTSRIRSIQIEAQPLRHFGPRHP